MVVAHLPLELQQHVSSYCKIIVLKSDEGIWNLDVPNDAHHLKC